MEFRFSGNADAVRLAYALREAGETRLTRELNRGSREAGEVIADEVEQHTAEYIPKNFERRWDMAFRAVVQVRLVQSRRVSVVFYADGRTVRRDIKAINEGRLRHPVFRRTRRLRDGTLQTNPWVLQRIRPGIVDEPAARAMPGAIKKIDDAVSRVVAQIEKGT